MWELWYWCYQTREWRKLGGADYSDLGAAIATAGQLSAQSGRAVRVEDMYTGEVLHQAGQVRYLDPAATMSTGWAT